MSIEDFLNRIVKYCDVDASTLIIAMIYLEKFFSSKVTPTSANIHKSLIVSVMIADKFNEDLVYDTQFFSKVGGISTEKINLLESLFLSGIKYDLFVSDKDILNFLRKIQNDKLPRK